ncbi:hypothetical protein GCM10025880_39320 [Methylorubrum aminovorans]|nr:hypothetical protein GCM10025880_39320 [Methylorubrum aminovorans]
MLAVEETLGHVNQFLDDRPDTIAAELADLRARVMRLAETPYDGATDYLIDVLDARAQVSELALRASQSALLHQGARGYLMSAAPQRRIREAHFVAIVTPAIKHLRWEMARLSRETLPTAEEAGHDRAGAGRRPRPLAAIPLPGLRPDLRRRRGRSR